MGCAVGSLHSACEPLSPAGCGVLHLPPPPFWNDGIQVMALRKIEIVTTSLVLFGNFEVIVATLLFEDLISI